jgi:hypothetical protein
MQFTYNVILRCFRVTIFAMEKQDVLNIISVCLHSCMFSALYYFVVHGLSGSTIFFHVINDAMFEKNLLNVKCLFSFLLNLSETFLILRRIELDIIINIYGSLCKVPAIRVNYNYDV